MLSLVLVGLPSFCLAAPGAGEVRSEDAVVRWTDDALEMANDAVLMRLSTASGLSRVAWAGAGTNLDLLAGQTLADFVVTVDGRRLRSDDPGWVAAEPVAQVLAHGEIEVRLALERDGLRVTRTYIICPGISLVRGWLDIENSGQASLLLVDPPIATLPHGAGPDELHWMSGAEQFGDSWRLRSEPLSPEPRVFDSYDPPPAVSGSGLAGDGVDARILLNGRPVWPEDDWAHSGHASDVQRHEVTLEVTEGDQISFVLARHEQMTCDTTEWDPVVAYDDGASYRASEGFSTIQGDCGWYYGYLSDDGEYRDLTYADVPGRYGQRWRLDVDVVEPFVSETEMHPDPQGAAVRTFVAPSSGSVTVSGTLANTGQGGPAGRGFRLGSMAYAPWFSLSSGQASAYVGFDCMAHWRAEISPSEEGSGASLDVTLAGYTRQLAPGESVRTPGHFMGIFGTDLDNMGQEILEWQYRCMWDYTREPWFPGVRMLGYWMKGTHWGSHGWVGGDADYESAYRKVFRTADFMREVGGDTYHRDWGWWDRAGDWNGPDFLTSGEYLRQYGMGQLIYAFIYTVDPQSRVAQAHPEWLADGTTLDQSLPEVVEYEVELLDSFRERFGPFQWRNDSFPLAPRGGDDTVLLGQQQGFMEVLRRFLDSHPECAFQGVNGGGMGINWEYLGYASGFQFTDGQSQALANYHASYLFPPDKINDMPDIWDPASYDPATWRGLLCSNFDMTGDTFSPDQLEGLRELVDIYHYLGARGVVGRWVRVYHPLISGDDETMYLQRLSWDRLRGVIITKHRIEGTVTIRPKGLVPEALYEVGFQDSPATMEATGTALMTDGITLSDPAPGELIYLNLPDHPGNSIDTTPPSAPTGVRTREARHMGVPGVEVIWEPSTDDHWLSYYLVTRDGERIGTAAKGAYWFDHSAGADPAAVYAVQAVDGAGNVSDVVSCEPADGPRRHVIDDGDLELVGSWVRESDFPPAHAGTLAYAAEAGAGFSVSFTGRGVTWHGRLGAEGGLAIVQVDNEPPVTVSCYAADEIPGWPMFERHWEVPGPHVLRVRVIGEADPRGTGARVWLDAIALEP
jgi:hypothetical protein